MDIPASFGALFFWGFCGALSLLCAIFAFIGSSIRDDFKEMSKSLQGVTIGLASLTVKLDSLDARLEKLERVSDD